MPVPDAEEVVGREEDVTWLDQCWNDGVRIATIVAIGGAGKSTLVHEWLERMDNAQWRGAERVYGWSFYRQGTAGGASSDEFFDDAFKWFGDPNPPTAPWEKGRRLAELVQKERTLLILDGIEPLQNKPNGADAPIQDTALKSLIRSLSSANAGLCLLTTRVAMTDVKAKGPGISRTRELKRLSDKAGAALLRKRGADGLKAELHTAVRDYEGHALALTLLGTYVREAFDGQIARRHGLPAFEGEPAQRMMALYEQWFSDKPELAILHLLGLFDRPAPKDEIEALRQDSAIPGLTEDLVRTRMFDSPWNTAVTRLRDVGLVAPRNADGSLDVHPLVREYFGRRLQKDQPDAFREGHRRLYEFLQKKAKPFPNTLIEMEPLYQAVRHGCLAGKHQEAFIDIWWKRVNRETDHFGTRRLRTYSAELAMLSAFFTPAWEQLAQGLNLSVSALVTSQAGNMLRAVGKLKEATTLTLWGFELFASQGDLPNSARTADNLSEILETAGALAHAERTSRDAVLIADQSGNMDLRILNRCTLASIQYARGYIDEAGELFEKAESMQVDYTPPLPLLTSGQGFDYCEYLLEYGLDSIVRSRCNITITWLVQANVDVLSIALAHLSLARANLIGMRQTNGASLTETETYFERAVEGLRRCNVQEVIPLGLLARAELYIHTRDLGDARIDLEEAMDIATHCGFRLHECDAHLGYARLAIAEKNPTDAEAHLNEARQIINDTGYHRRDRDVNEIAKALAQLKSSSLGDTNHG